MELSAFRAQLHARGDAADVWLAYAIDPFEEVQGGRIVLVLQRAFWTRGETCAWAQASREQKRWQQFYIFTVTVTSAWAEGTGSYVAAFETQFGRPRPLPVVRVSPTELAAALEC